MRPVVVAPAETLAVSVVGVGEPIVLLPGLFGSAFGFRRLTPLLVKAGYETIVVEPLGVGHSTRPKQADYSLTAQATRVAAVLDSLARHDVIVIAHSLGASIAMRMAVTRPELVAGIISLEGGPAEEATTSGFRTAMRFAPLLKLFGGSGLIRKELHRRLVASSGDASWVTEEVVDGYTAGATRDFGATLDAFKGMAKSVEPWSLGEALGKIRCPVRLLIGRAPHTSGIPPEQIEALRVRVMMFAVDEVPGAGHFLFEERPEAVMDAVLRLQVDRASALLFPFGRAEEVHSGDPTRLVESRLPITRSMFPLYMTDLHDRPTRAP